MKRLVEGRCAPPLSPKNGGTGVALSTRCGLGEVHSRRDLERESKTRVDLPGNCLFFFWSQPIAPVAMDASFAGNTQSDGVRFTISTYLISEARITAYGLNTRCAVLTSGFAVWMGNCEE